MLAGLEKSRDLCEFLRCKHFPEGWHIHAAIHDANHEVALGQLIADITEIGSSTAAIAVDQVAIEATFVMKEFCAAELRFSPAADRAANGANFLVCLQRCLRRAACD